MTAVRTSWQALLAVALTASVGCTSWFIQDDNTNYLTPAKRIEGLKALADEAESKSPAERQGIVTDLALKIRDEDDPLLREEMLRTLSRYPSPTARAVLEAGLKDGDPHVRRVAVQAIDSLGGKDAALLLAETVRSDTDDDVRLAATKALAKYDDPQALSALAAVLDDRNPALQYRAMDSLRDTTGKDFGNDVVAWREYLKTGDPNLPERSLADRVRELRPF
jgi:HEAT repeat protein